MKIIPKGSTFLVEGGLVLGKDEVRVVIHALIEERARVVNTGGRQYGPLHIEELNHFISELQEYEKQRGT